jgi:hypothetical protein
VRTACLACRRTWVGAPWMDAVSDNPLNMNLVPSMKRKKGKKKDAAAGVCVCVVLRCTYCVQLCCSRLLLCHSTATALSR